MGKTANYSIPYPELTDKANVPEDIKAAVEVIDTELGNKINKETGKRLITNEEATKLAGLENYDDSELIKLIDSQNIDIKYLEKQVEQLLKDHKPIPFNGVSNHLQDTGDFPMPISINGGIEQEQRQGYNILDYSEIGTVTRGGITLEYTEDGYLVANGTQTASWLMFFSKNITNILEDGKTYTIWAEDLSQSLYNTSFYLQVTATKADGTNTNYYLRNSLLQFTVDKTTYVQYMVHMQMANYSLTLNNAKNRFMIYEGTDNKVWEQYGASPSIPFPSEVKGVGGHYDNVISNKNIWNGVIEAGSLANGINENYNQEARRSKDFIAIKPSTNYAFSVNGTLNRVVVSLYDKNKQFISNDGSNGINASNGLFITYENAEYMRFRSYNDDKTLFETGKIQLEENTVATDYVAHQEQNLPLDIPIGQVWYNGKPYKENGKWYRPIESVKLPFNTDTMKEPKIITTYVKDTLVGLAITIRASANHFVSGSNVYSNKFKSKKLLGASDTTSEESVRNSRGISTSTGNNHQLAISIEKTELEKDNVDITNATDIFNWLIAQDFYFVLEELLTPLEPEEITDTTLISQLEELQKADSYKEVTNINSYRASEDVAPLVLSGNALMSNDLRMSKLESALLNVSAEV